MIDPGMWDNPLLAALDFTTRLFYIGIISFADDEGRILGEANWLRSRIFPFDDKLSIDTVEKMVVTLHAKRFIVCYEFESVRYIEHPHWTRFQSIPPSKFQRSTIPSSKDGITIADTALVQRKQVVARPKKRKAYTANDAPQWARDVLADWVSVHALPKQANPAKCLTAIHELHRIDKHSPQKIATVCAYIVRNKVPTFIRSPMKLRQTTRAGDEQTFQLYADNMTNGTAPASQQEDSRVDELFDDLQ